MRLRTLALALLLVPLLLPAASAQFPESCAFERPVVVVPGPLVAGSTGEVSVRVAERAGNPAGIVVTVTAQTATPGWDIAPTQRSLTLASKAEGVANFTLEPTQAAAEDAIVQITVSGTCPLPGGQACPAANACTAPPQKQDAVVGLAQPEGLQIPFLSALGIPVEYVLAGLVLVAVAAAIPLVVRRKPAMVQAECAEPLKMVRPGRGTSFPIEVRNPSGEALTARVEVGPVPEGWSAFMPLPEVQVAGRETRSLFLMVRAPAEAKPGDTVDVEITLRNAQRPERKATVRVRAEVDPAAVEPRLG